MKRFWILGIVLFAMGALGAVVSTSAMAARTLCVPVSNTGLWGLQVAGTQGEDCEELLTTSTNPFELLTFLRAQNLANGTLVATELPISMTGELLLEDKKASLGIKAMVLCSVTLEGSVNDSGEGGEGEITELLSLGGTAIPTKALEGTGLLCSGQEGCNSGTENDEVWFVHFPWPIVGELVEWDGHTGGMAGFDILLFGIESHQPGWYVKCATALGTAEDECVVETTEGVAEEATAEAKNVASGVEDSFSEEIELGGGDKNDKCSSSSESGTGVMEGKLLETLTESGTLAYSSGT